MQNKCMKSKPSTKKYASAATPLWMRTADKHPAAHREQTRRPRICTIYSGETVKYLEWKDDIFGKDTRPIRVTQPDM
jgi:hypothetical protein